MFGRRLRRTAAPLLLLAWIAGLALPVLGARHASAFDDPACERPLGTSGHARTQIEKDVPITGNGHCGICHLQRAVRGALHSVVRSVQYAQTIGVSRVVWTYDLRTIEHDVASSRGPPSFLLTEAS
jgi:hypothetical protein